MNSLLVPILGFLICAFLIVIGGSRLSYYGDRIAELTGMGKAWLGVVLMASITSLPELITGISSVALVQAPDIAVGNVMGSCVFNLLILAVLDFLTPAKTLLSRVSKNHLLVVFMSTFLPAITVAALVFPGHFLQMGWIGMGTVLLAAGYFCAIRLLFLYEQRSVLPSPAAVIAPPQSPPEVPLSTAVLRYTLFALLIVGVALALPYFAENLADQLGLERSFVGTLLMPIATSLPELVVSISALRIGSTDLAVGNLLGSNLFNMLILTVDDLLFASGPIYDHASKIHGFTALGAIVLTTIAGIGILSEPGPKKFRLGTSSLFLVAVYLSIVVVLWQHK